MYDEIVEENEDCVFSINDYKDLAKTYISLFFKNKVDENGDKIDPELLFTDRNVSLVLNLNICDGMPLIYKALEPLYKEKKKSKIPGEVQFVLKMLNECGKISAPKPFAVGLIAVYIEVCKDCVIDYERS